MSHRSVVRAQGWRACLLALLLSLIALSPAASTDRLRPPDRSSPRATLFGFIAIVDAVYDGVARTLQSYAASGRLYLSAGERQAWADLLHRGAVGTSYLDLSAISPVLRDSVALERLIQLKEVLDRITLPATDAIPDLAEVRRTGIKRWRIPDTEIDLVMVEDGPRQGEFLFSADTIEHLPRFYRVVSDLPYAAGPAERLNRVYQALSNGRTDTIYEAALNSPAGLSMVVPLRWMLSLPDWARLRLFGAATWQWAGLAIATGIVALLLAGTRRLERRLAPGPTRQGVTWHHLPMPIAILLVTGVLIPMVCAMLRLGGTPRVLLTYVESGAFYIAVAWLAVVGSNIVGEAIVSAEHLTSASLDGQLVMLAAHGVGVVAAILCLIQGADELGFPAYSVVAGLGVGGLAMALAARDTVANFLGSILIMLEKPFRVGHVIRVGGSEGTVESIGLRSTRLRTPENSVVSIPSSVVVSATVENLTLRPLRRQRFLVQAIYDTPRETLTALIEAIDARLRAEARVDPDKVQVRLNAFGESSLDILVMFHLIADNQTQELRAREDILLGIMQDAEALGVSFAFPTRTVQLSGAAPAPAGVG